MTEFQRPPPQNKEAGLFTLTGEIQQLNDSTKIDLLIKAIKK